MLKESKEHQSSIFTKLKFNTKFSLSQQIVILITLVVCVALLPASLFTTYKVSRVVYDRVSINAVSINNILCNSDEIKRGLQVYSTVEIESANELMGSYVNDVDHSDEAGVAIYDRYRRLRVMYNPGKLPNFAPRAQVLVDKYAPLNEIGWKENYAIPNQAFGFVRNDNGETIGYVVTGYSDDLLNKSTLDAVMFLLILVTLGLLVGIFGAIFLAGRIKKVLFGYEPEEIARLLQERNVILDSVREGIINVNSNGVITVVNFEAHNLLTQAGIADCDNLCGRSAKDVFKTVPLDAIIKGGKTVVDASVKVGSILFIITAVPLIGEKKILGAVITFRKKSVVEEMANQLTGFKNYATALRAQTHEFMN